VLNLPVKCRPHIYNGERTLWHAANTHLRPAAHRNQRQTVALADNLA
jgi:hypothetical protein